MASIVAHPAVRPITRAELSDPAHQAFALLRVGFTVAPILFGLDKFLDWLVDWLTRKRYRLRLVVRRMRSNSDREVLS